MSAAVVLWWRKRRGGKPPTSSATVNVPNPRAKLERNYNESLLLSTTTLPFTTPEDQAAQKIQAVFRGYLVRRDLRLVLMESSLAGPSIQVCIDLVLDWYEGWITQFVVLVLLVLGCLAMAYQMFDDAPSAFSADSSLLARVSHPDLMDARSRVMQSTNLYAFVLALINVVNNLEHGSSDAAVVDVSAECASALNALCPANQSRIALEFGNVTQNVLQHMHTHCPNMSADSGYIDATRRIVGSVYLTQTRRKAVPCHVRMSRVDPYLGIGRPCLSAVEEDTEFLPPPPSVNTPHSGAFFGQFAFLPQWGFFAHALTGSAFNLPVSFAQCRIRELQRKGWLDARTKRVCVMAALVDLEGQGRLSAYKECFEFLPGGRVVSSKEVASLSFLAGRRGASAEDAENDAPFGLAIFCILVFSARLVWLAVQTLRRSEYAAGMRFWLLDVLGAALSLAGNCMYVHFARIMSSFEFHPSMDEEIFFADSFAYVDEINHTFALADFWQQYCSVASVGLFFLVVNAVSKLDFHPSSALINGILSRAAMSLSVFGFVAIIFIATYALIGMALFSRTFTMFNTYGSAVNTLLLMCIGDTTLLQEEITGADNQARSLVMQTIYFWVFVLLGSILFLQVLQAILTEAFVHMSDSVRGEGVMLTLFRSMGESAYMASIQAWVQLQRWFRAPLSRCRTTDDYTRETPREILLRLRKTYRINGTTAPTLREELGRVFYSSQTLEIFLLRCRSLSHQAKFKSKEMFLRGLDPNSAALKGHTVNLLETIDTRQKLILAKQLTQGRSHSTHTSTATT